MENTTKNGGQVVNLKKSAEPIEGTPIFALIYATTLLQQGRETSNPLMVGLASVIYFTIGDKQYATDLLSEATKIALQNKDSKSLSWLADIWGDSFLGAGNSDKAKQTLAQAQRIEQFITAFKTRGKPLGVKASSLLPPEYEK
jgi:hypothetical protein